MYQINFIELSSEKELLEQARTEADYQALFKKVQNVLSAQNYNRHLLAFARTPLEVKIIFAETNNDFSGLLQCSDKVELEEQSRMFGEIEKDIFYYNSLQRHILECDNSSRRKRLRKLKERIADKEYPLNVWLACIRCKYECLSRYNFKEDFLAVTE